jgi:hypothetical protein
MAHEEWDREIIRRIVVIKEEVLLKDGISGKFFANNYARR